jgi:quercetin dioxygenase-like cupin family protein
LIWAAIIAGFVTCGSLAAQQQPIKVTRIYTGADGQAHAEEIDVQMTRSTSPGSERSPAINVASLQFSRSTAGTFSDWHNAPRRQFIVTISGRAEVELLGGQKIPVEPGRVLQVEDLKGKGHITRTLASADWVYVIIPFADQ